jgi:hypothetical protein
LQFSIKRFRSELLINWRYKSRLSIDDKTIG